MHDAMLRNNGQIRQMNTAKERKDAAYILFFGSGHERLLSSGSEMKGKAFAEACDIGRQKRRGSKWENREPDEDLFSGRSRKTLNEGCPLSLVRRPMDRTDHRSDKRLKSAGPSAGQQRQDIKTNIKS